MKPAESAPPALPTIGPADRLGAVVPAPAATALEGADLTNVIVLAHRRQQGGADAPEVKLGESERPAPPVSWRDRVPWTALIAGALLLHLALVLTFMREPAPMPSLALDSISVEIVLGGETEAGLAERPSTVDSAPSVAATSPAEPVVEPPTEVEQQKPDLRPRIEAEPRETQREQTVSEEEPKPAEPRTAAAEPEPQIEAAEPEPTPTPTQAPQAAVAVAAEVEPAPKPAEPEAAPPVETQATKQSKTKPVETPRPQSKPTPPRVAASRSGVGVGSSRDVRDWAARVSAHLARNKRYPADALAQGLGGTASVSFTLDGDGRVTSVRLARSSGHASLDRESQDLVRRASPFPPPPQGKASITVPVNYNVRTGR